MTLPALSDKESLAGSSVALLACPSRTAQRWSVATTTSDRRRQTHLLPLLNKRRLSYVAQLELANVWFWHKADIKQRSADVRFWR